MRAFLPVHLVLFASLAIASAGFAQTPQPVAAPVAPTGATIAPADTTAAPAEPAINADSPAAPQATEPAPASSEPARSLFDPAPRQFLLGGRFTSIDGDPARFQRYQDLRGGVVFSDFRFAKEDADGNWKYHFTADNVGYRDQKCTGSYERTGRLVISGLWDEIPQFYSVDTKTPYSLTKSPLLTTTRRRGSSNRIRHRFTRTCRSRPNSI